MRRSLKKETRNEVINIASKKMDLNKMMAECTKPHALVHSFMGVGLGLILVGLMPSLFDMAIVLGLLVVAMAIFADFVVQSKM